IYSAHGNLQPFAHFPCKRRALLRIATVSPHALDLANLRNGFELSSRLQSRAGDSNSSRVLAGQEFRRDAAGGARADLAEIIALVQAEKIPRLRGEQRNQESQAFTRARINLQAHVPGG